MIRIRLEKYIDFPQVVRLKRVISDSYPDLLKNPTFSSFPEVFVGFGRKFTTDEFLLPILRNEKFFIFRNLILKQKSGFKSKFNMNSASSE